MKSYSTREVSEITGATLRQLQFWDEQGYVVPIRIGGKSPTGDVRNYSEDQVRTIRVIVSLRSKSVWLHRIVPHLPALRKILKTQAKYLVWANGFAGFDDKASCISHIAKLRTGAVLVEL